MSIAVIFSDINISLPHHQIVTWIYISFYLCRKITIFNFSTMHKPDMASFFVSEENPAAMAASGSMKIVFNFSCFSTSLLAALLPFLPLLPFFNIWSAIVSQVFALTAKKPTHIRHSMLVSTALVVSVPWMLVYQVYFIIGFT